MTYREALRLAMREELARDERVFIMGEEVGLFDGSYKVTAGLMDEFGPDRVRDTPISEEGFVGAGVGALVAGVGRDVTGSYLMAWVAAALLCFAAAASLFLMPRLPGVVDVADGRPASDEEVVPRP